MLCADVHFKISQSAKFRKFLDVVSLALHILFTTVYLGFLHYFEGGICPFMYFETFFQSFQDAVFNPSMFGNTLEDIMEMQESRYPDNRLPWILTTLAEAVLLQNGLQTEGIFRYEDT